LIFLPRKYRKSAKAAAIMIPKIVTIKFTKFTELEDNSDQKLVNMPSSAFSEQNYSVVTEDIKAVKRIPGMRARFPASKQFCGIMCPIFGCRILSGVCAEWGERPPVSSPLQINCPSSRPWLLEYVLFPAHPAKPDR